MLRSVIRITIFLLTCAEEKIRYVSKFEKGKPPEKAGRKVSGLSLRWDKAAGLPGCSEKVQYS